MPSSMPTGQLFAFILSYRAFSPFSDSPDLVDYSSLKATKPVANMHLAFDTAEKYFGLPSLLDPPGLFIFSALIAPGLNLPSL